jgi:hypothetical protein
MKRLPYTQLSHGRPVRSQQLSLPFDGCGNGLRRRRKGGLHRISNCFEVDAAVLLDRRVEQCQVPRDGSTHRHPISLPALGTPLDIGE